MARLMLSLKGAPGMLAMDPFEAGDNKGEASRGAGSVPLVPSDDVGNCVVGQRGDDDDDDATRLTGAPSSSSAAAEEVEDARKQESGPQFVGGEGSGSPWGAGDQRGFDSRGEGSGGGGDGILVFDELDSGV